VEAVYRHEIDVLCERADELLGSTPPDLALAEWMRLFVRHVAPRRACSRRSSRLLSSNPSISDQTRGRATAAASKLLAAGVAAGTVRGDIDGADFDPCRRRHLHVDRPGTFRWLRSALSVSSSTACAAGGGLSDVFLSRLKRVP